MESKSKYPIGGYAPGNYISTCTTCKTEFIGDKRAVQCEPCAIKMTEEQVQSIIENIREIAEKEEE
jgi:Zn-finger protein